MEQPIFERLRNLCDTNGISITALCEEITGSKGNLQTWKKGNIRTDYLLSIAKKFNISIDYLLGLYTDTDEIKKARTLVKSWLESTDTAIQEIEQTIGTNYVTIKLWSCGIGDFFNTRLTILADLIGCSVDYLLGRTDVVEVNMGYSYYPEEIAAHGADGTRGTFTLPPKETT